MTGSARSKGVSVIIPAFRAHGTIARAIQSLQCQTMPEWEAVIVSDDGTDYRSFLDVFGIADTRLRFASTGRIAAGPSVARNIGLSVATGTFVAPLDADDLFLPDRLAELLPMAEAWGAAADNLRVVREPDEILLHTAFPVGEGVDELTPNRFAALPVPMFFIAERGIAGRWEEDLVLAQDVVFNMKILDRLGVVPLARRPLYEYRQRPGSLSFSEDSSVRVEADYQRILDRLAGDGLGLRSAAVRALLADAVTTKRALNHAFEQARRSGLCASFQEYVALTGRLPSAP